MTAPEQITEPVIQQQVSVPQSVRIVDINMPFWHLTLFLVKLALAAIPAVFIFALTLAVISLIAGAAFAVIGIGTAGFSRGLSEFDPPLATTPTVASVPAGSVPTTRVAPTATASPANYDLALVRVADRSTDTGFTVDGSFSNRGRDPSPDIIVVITFIDRDTGLRRTAIDTVSAIQPGQTSDFTITTPGSGNWAYTIDIKSAGADRQPLEYRDIAP